MKIRVHGLATALFGEGAPEVYVHSFDVDARKGLGSVLLTLAIDEAMTFADTGAALEAWKTQSTVRPLRDDGKPNRPMTAYTVEVIR